MSARRGKRSSAQVDQLEREVRDEDQGYQTPRNASPMSRLGLDQQNSNLEEDAEAVNGVNTSFRPRRAGPERPF